MCQRCWGNVPCPLPQPILSCLVCLVFQVDKACDEAIGHVLGSRRWYLILPDKDDGVCTSVATRHALGKASNFISIGVGSPGLCLGVGNELLIFK